MKERIFPVFPSHFFSFMFCASKNIAEGKNGTGGGGIKRVSSGRKDRNCNKRGKRKRWRKR